jgi:hypothetical protein
MHVISICTGVAYIGVEAAIVTAQATERIPSIGTLNNIGTAAFAGLGVWRVTEPFIIRRELRNPGTTIFAESRNRHSRAPSEPHCIVE